MSLRFNVADLNAIETRVAAWVAQCGPLLKVFREDRDPYLDFAMKMSGVPYDKLFYDLKKNPDKIRLGLRDIVYAPPQKLDLDHE